MARLYFALDLKDDPALIAEYEDWHRPERIWPDIVAQLGEAQLREVEILRCGNRLVMVMDTADAFSAADQAALGAGRSAQWENLMWNFQQALPFAEPGQKWVPMKRIFSLQQTREAQGR